MTAHAPARARAAFTAAFAVCLSLGAGTAAQAAATGSLGPQAVGFKTRSVAAMLAATSPASSVRAAADDPEISTSARVAASADTTSDQPATSTPLPSLDGAADAAAGTCDDLQLDWTPTNDRVWVHWQDIGAAGYTVLRLRDGGSWKPLGTTTATSLLDTGVNPDAVFTYRVVADGLACDLGSWVSMATEDGWGVPDFAYGSTSTAGTGVLMLQDPSSLAMPTTTGGMDPAFSPDGRRVAVAWQSPDLSWHIDIALVGHAGSDPVVKSLPMPDGYVGADPSWSPDGRSVAYTRYQLGDTGSVANPELHVMDARTGADRAVAGSTGLVQADWRSSTLLVAAGFDPGEGLFNLLAAGGTRSAIADTANAAHPQVAPDGRIWFVAFDGETGTVRAVVPQAFDHVGTVRTSTTHLYDQPRIAPDGTVFVMDVDRHDLSNTDDDTFTVVTGTFGPDGMATTAVGLSVDAGLEGFLGYDVRQPRTKGTSDFVGDAGPDILGRDSAGTMWAYPSTPDALAGQRVRIGVGWNIYNGLLAAGDLNGDDRADILARDKSGYLWRYDGLGQGKVRPRVKIGSGWGSYLPVATGDFNGDQVADLVARQSTGALWLYPGTGSGTLGARVQIGAGWNVMNAIVGVGDFDLDNHADLVAREASTGKLWLYPGNGTGGFRPRRQVGAGWQIFSGLAGPELLGSNPMVYARRTDGVLLAYRVLGDGRFSGDEVYQGGSGWSTYSFTS